MNFESLVVGVEFFLSFIAIYCIILKCGFFIILLHDLIYIFIFIHFYPFIYLFIL